MKISRKILSLAFFICFVPIIFLILTYIGKLTRVAYISQIDLRIFYTLLSLLASFSIWYFLSKNSEEKLISINRNRLTFAFLVLLTIAFFMFIVNYGNYRSYGSMVYLPWTQIPIFLLISTIVLYGVILYVPAYLIHRVAFSSCEVGSLTKIVLYPVVTMLIFGFVGFLPLKDLVYFELLVPLFIITCLFIILFDNHIKKGSGNTASTVNVSINELLMLTLIILFRLFLQFSAAGEIDAFVRGDATGQAGNVAFLNRYGIAGYLSSALTERYPMFFFAAWSTLTWLLPLPYCNTLVLTEFFNQIFTTLTFYIFAKTLLQKTDKSLFATLAFTLLSGFSWFYILTDPPPSFTSTENIYNYYWKIFNKFGTSSGAPTSTVYADDHALVRLWSLGLSFGFVAALLNILKGSKSRKFYLAVALACLIQIALGHTTEIILINVMIIPAILLTKTGHSFKETLAILGTSTLVSEVIALLLSYSFLSLILIGSPFLIFIFITVAKRVADKSSAGLFLKSKRAFFNVIALLFIFYYGLSWIAFTSNYYRVWIGVPLINLWYVFPIEWGFSGFLFLLALIKVASGRWDNMPNYLEYAIFAFFTLFSLVIFMDCINFFFVYTYVTNVFIPNYFIPFFALSSVFLVENLASAKIEKFKGAFFLSFLIVILVFASFNYIVSTSYWKSCGWRYETSPFKTLTNEEIQLANTLHNIPRSLSLEMCAYLPASDPIPEVDETTYQKMVRYPIYDEDYIILLSGFKIPQRIVNDVLYKARSINELIFLEQFYPLDYLVVEKNSTSFLAHFLKENEIPIFEGQRYLVYNISHFRSTKSCDLDMGELVIVDKVTFRGNITLSSENSTEMMLSNVTGEISPLENNLVTLKYYNEGDIANEICIYDDQEKFWKGCGWGQGAVGIPALHESEDMQIAGLRCAEIDVPPGNFTVSAIYHCFSEPYPNWSEYDFISVYLYGINDLGKITLAVYGGGDKGSNAYLWYITDNFYGWKHFIIPLNKPDYKGSDFNITSIRQIQIRWNTPGVRYIGKISIFAMERKVFSVQNVHIEGQISLINFRASANYFPEARNLAQKIDISGSVSFNIINTFNDNRLYIGSLRYEGESKIYPEPWHMTSRVAKQSIQAYVTYTNISFLEILKEPYGLAWTILCFIFTIFTTIKKLRIKISFRRRNV